MALDYKSFGLVLTVLLITPSIFRLTAIWLHQANTICNQDLRSTAIYGAKNYHFQDIATIRSVVA
jgi:hypothetical protein